MAQLVVRNLDDDVKVKLRQRARRHGRSTEAEVREILRIAVGGDDRRVGGFGTRFAAHFAGLGFDEDIPEWRGFPAEPPDLS